MSKHVITLIVEDYNGSDPSGWAWSRMLGAETEFVSSRPADTFNSDTDDILRNYEDRLQEIYDNQTAGDHTFIGVLASMLLDLNAAGVVTFLTDTRD